MKIFYLNPYTHRNNDFIQASINRDSLGFSHYDVEKGELFTDWNENIIAWYEHEENWVIEDYINNNLSWFLINDKIKNILTELVPEHLQFLPLTLRCVNKPINDIQVYVCNVLNVVDTLKAVDLERSVFYSPTDNDGVSNYIFYKQCFKSEALTDQDIFMLSRSSRRIFVSERVKKAIMKIGITGCGFTKQEVI